MNIYKMIEQIEMLEKTKLQNPFKIGILPNDGGLITGFPEAMLSFNDEAFTIYVLDGLVKLTYERHKINFLYDDIKEVELGKYNFKDDYMKIIFEDDKFIAFNYHNKHRKYKEQKDNMNRFFKLIESMSG